MKKALMSATLFTAALMFTAGIATRAEADPPLSPASPADPTSASSAVVGRMVFLGEDPTGVPPGPVPAPAPELTPRSDAARRGFLQVLGDWGTESFAGFTPGYYDSAPVVFGTLGTGRIETVYDDRPFGLTGGETLINSGDGIARPEPGDFWLVLDQPVNAIGFEGLDIGESARLRLEFVDAAGDTVDVVDVPHAFPADTDSVLYFGYVRPGEGFVAVKFISDPERHDLFVFRDMTVGLP